MAVRAVIAVQQLCRVRSILRGDGGSVGMPRRTNSLSGARMPRQVDYYFSFQSPWAYIGHKLFRES